MRQAFLILLAAASVAVAVLASARRGDAGAETPRAAAERSLAAWRGEAEPTSGTVPPSAPLFTDVASSMGLSFAHDNAARGEFWIPEEMGPGAGFLDYDGDGDLDVFVAGGGTLDGTGAAQNAHLYRNDGERFTDVTDQVGAGLAGHAMGVACADFDDDGDVDVFVGRVGANALLRNDGDRFTEVAAAAGVADAGFASSAAFVDYDRDGDLDLYVVNYVQWSPDRESPCYLPNGARDYCNPVTYGPTVDRLYRNRGDGTFEDVTQAAGIAAETGNGLGVVASDFDGDGFPDLYVANDQTPALLWHNKGDGTFVNEAAARGCAYDFSGVAIAGMGVGCEDLDDDGDLDLLVTNIHDQTHLVLANDGGLFSDVSQRFGVSSWSRPATAFGVAIFDQDRDGNLDMFFANGEVNADNRMKVADNPFAQPDHFVRLVNGRLIDASVESGAAFADVGRGVAAGDFDGDGDVDLLVTNNGGPVRLLRNDDDSGNAWLVVDARTGSGRAAIGARVEVEANGRMFVREVRPQQSYLCSGDARAHFGLGSARRIDRVEIVWPDGRRTLRRGVDVNQVLRVDDDEEMGR